MEQSGGKIGGETDAGGFGGDLELLHQVIDYFTEIEARFLQHDLPALRLREQQQGAHDLGQAVDILQRVEHGLAILVGGLGGEERDFELAADGGDGRAQFVGNVGGELAHLLEAGLQALDHAVEGENQVVEFVAGIASGDAQAEVGAGDALRGLGDGEHGRERAARHEIAQQRAEQESARDHAGEDPGVRVQGLHVIRVGSADRDVIRRAVLLRIDDSAADLDGLAGGSPPVLPEDSGLGGGYRLQHFLADVGGLIDADVVVAGGNGGFVGDGIGNRVAELVGDQVDLAGVENDGGLVRILGVVIPGGADAIA